MNNGKICIPVCAETADEMIAKIKQAEQVADVVEVRFDCLRKEELEVQQKLPNHAGVTNFNIESRKPILATFRPMEQGGHRDLSIEERSNFWSSGHETEYCDVEEEFLNDTYSWLSEKRICSFHDFSQTPDNLEAIFDRFVHKGADIVKIAVTAADAVDAIAVWRLLRYANQFREPQRPEVIPVAMGEAGKWTRILGLAHGAFLTYASLQSGDGTAPGQITARDMIEVYRVKELDENTEVYGVIGDPISQSLSPYIHNPAFAATGRNAVYVPFLVKDIDAFMDRMVKPGTREIEINLRGFSVTMPHKQSIKRHLDIIDETAREIGAVNTVMIDNGKLIGYNTDADGFVAPLKANFGDLRGSRVGVAGAGGSAKACVYALIRENAKVTVIARDTKKAKLLADEFGVDADVISKYQDRDPKLSQDFDILVDTTPLGMAGPLEDESLFTAEQLRGLGFVFDLVTKLTDTPLIQAARSAGVPAIGGLEMLVAQGARQYEIWTGESAPVEEMKNGALARYEQLNR